MTSQQGPATRPSADLSDALSRLVLYTLGVDGRPVGGDLKLQKILFLSSRSLPDMLGDSIHFEDHKMGPISEDVQSIVREFRDSGAISDEKLSLSPAWNFEFDSVERNVDPILSDVISFWKDFTSDLTTDEILTYVYITFPEYTRNSEKWDAIRPSRIRPIVSLVNKGKITAGKGAEMAGESYYDFENRLRGSKRKLG